jgi:hypothetical protein
MAGAAPTTTELQALIMMLQVQAAALTAGTPGAGAAPAAGAAPVVFNDMPQTMGAKDLIDYLMKRGSAIFDQGCKALGDKVLTDGFTMTPNQTVIFVMVFHYRTTAMGWNQGAKEITTFANSAGQPVDIIKSYHHIDGCM